MSKILKMVRMAKQLILNAMTLLIQGAEVGAATAALLAQAHDIIVKPF